MTEATPHDKRLAAEVLLDRELDERYPAGEPLPESSRHEIVRGEVAMMLRQYFAGSDDIWVASNRNLYYREGSPRAVVEPDIMVVSGVSTARLDRLASYRTWQHGGSVRFVLEVASKKTRRADRRRKRALYARLGVAEYWRLDPTGGELCENVLEAERLVDGRWTPIPVTESHTGSWWGRSDALELDLVWEDGELLLYRPGSELPQHNLARAEEALRDAEAGQHDAERARRDAERRSDEQQAEIDRLNELLRRDPPTGQSEDGDPPQPNPGD